MKLRYKYIVFLLLFLFIGSFVVQSQVAGVLPPKTRMVDRSLEELEGTTTTYYRYQSRSSKKELIKFYRLLFKNRSFKEVSGRGSSEAFFFFAKQEEGVMVTLTFLGSPKDGLITYSLKNHHLAVKKDSQKGSKKSK